MVRTFALSAAVFLAGPAWAACPAPSTNAELVEAMDKASLAFANLDIEAFQADAARSAELLPCLGEPVSRPTAAAWHRTRGLAAYLDRNSPAARQSFASARAIEPAYTFPTDVVPEGNPLLDDYTAVDPNEGPFELIPAPKTGTIRLDGSGSLNRSRSRPVIVQVLDGRGAVVQTAIVEPGDPTPALAGAGDGPTEGEPREPRRRGGPSVPLLIGAGVGALAAGGLYAGSARSRASYEATTDLEVLDARRSTTNTLVVGSGITAAVAVGLGTTSLFVSGRF